MQTVLVTGGCGIIGRYICSGLLKKGCTVIAVDREPSDYNEGKLRYTFVQCQPTDKATLSEILENNKIDVFIHAACTVDNDLGPIITEAQITESKQVDKFIYRYALTENVKKAVLLSTDQVYDFPNTREPIREEDDIKTKTKYSIMKYESEKAFVTELKHHTDVMGCIVRYAPVYTLNYTENLMAKITDPRDGGKFVYGKGQYGFQLCCVHNLVDFILCFVLNADDMKYAGTYNIGDKQLTTAADIISFMREKHHLGAVLQKTPSGSISSKIKGLFGGISKEEKTNYRYLDLTKLEYNNMLDTTKASKLAATFRWDIHNTK